jgi:hypothetical protein
MANSMNILIIIYSIIFIQLILLKEPPAVEEHRFIDLTLDVSDEESKKTDTKTPNNDR